MATPTNNPPKPHLGCSGLLVRQRGPKSEQKTIQKNLPKLKNAIQNNDF